MWEIQRKRSSARLLILEKMFSSCPSPSKNQEHDQDVSKSKKKKKAGKTKSISQTSFSVQTNSVLQQQSFSALGSSQEDEMGVEGDFDSSNEEEEEEENNPWALDQLLREDQVLSSPMSTWKKYARIILPHVGLILLSLLYVVGGAFVFYQVERPNEIAVRRESLQQIDEHKERMLEELWLIVNDNSTTQEEAEMLALEHVDIVSRLLFEAFDTHYISISHLRDQENTKDYSWTMITAIFFTTTLLTTIGYGNLVPVTATGRMFCIFYALFGVPLILITVADIGKFLSENIIWLYSMYTQAKKRLRQRQNRKRGGDSSPSSMSAMDEEKTKMRTKLQELGLDNYISIPIALIAAILLGYMTIGAVLLASWENWGLFEGFYFSFITMTTVGFGDIVPIKQQFFLIDLFYIIVGLAITTMCIDLVGIEYIEKIHYFGRAISGARFALVNVGGKMVRVPDLVRCAHLLHQKYGQKKAQHKLSFRGAYTPKDIAYIRFIDYSALASFESVSSVLSNLFTASQKSGEPSVV